MLTWKVNKARTTWSSALLGTSYNISYVGYYSQDENGFDVDNERWLVRINLLKVTKGIRAFKRADDESGGSNSTHSSIEEAKMRCMLHALTAKVKAQDKDIERLKAKFAI